MCESEPTGTLLGGSYRVGATLGKRGMGVVYEAVQEDLGRRVAVKVLHPTFHSDGLQRFRLDAQSAAALGHPNIVQVTDFQVNPGEPAFLVMERLDGRSLAQTIAADGPLPEARVAFIVTQMLSGLSAAHRANIVHRDIKPDKVFLRSMTAVHDLVKLLDFGIAKLQEEPGTAQLTVAGTMIGTPAYMSPEQARGLPIDARTDATPLPIPSSGATRASHGKVARVIGTDAGVYATAPVRDRAEAKLDAATACLAKFPPPDTSPSFFATVNASGLVMEVGNANGAGVPRNASLGRCMWSVFTSMHLGRPDAAGFFRVSYGYP